MSKQRGSEERRGGGLPVKSPEGHQQRFLVERPAGALAGLKFMLCSWRRNSVMPSAESEGLRQKVFMWFDCWWSFCDL